MANSKSKKVEKEKVEKKQNNQIQILWVDKNLAKVLIKNIDVSMANALRRIMMVEVK